jgi:NAD(P)-dependent dehydrogenase (short-subunit alcohol dehydrogenase family)
VRYTYPIGLVEVCLLYTDYAVFKGAIASFTIGLAKEVAAAGIRVITVQPGLIYTDIHTQGGEPGRVCRLMAKIPLFRGREAQEDAGAIIWLLSDRASFTTGSFIDVAGGL